MNTHTVTLNEIQNTVKTGRQARDFNVLDKKGRAIGGVANLYEADRTIAERELYVSCPQGEVKPAGRVYGYSPHATRDGEWFGAIQGTQWFDTAEQRDAAVARYFANAEKRAKKATNGS